MMDALLIFFPIVAALLVLLALALRAPGKISRRKLDLSSFEESGRRHVTYFALIRQASSPADLDFLEQRGSRNLANRVRKERRKVALLYLAQLRDDFRRLLFMARAVAALSPAVDTRQELRRLWLSLAFSWRYQMIRAGFSYGLLPVPQLNALSLMISDLAVRIDTSMKELGERAAVAARIASSLDGNGVDVA